MTVTDLVPWNESMSNVSEFGMNAFQGARSHRRKQRKRRNEF